MITSNVRAYSELHKTYDGDSKLYIYHPACAGLMKTYLFFDIIHLIKNIRNNLLNQKKFVFPSFSFDLFEDNIEVPAGYITWLLFYKIYENDQALKHTKLLIQVITNKAYLLHWQYLMKQQLQLYSVIFHRERMLQTFYRYSTSYL